MSTDMTLNEAIEYLRPIMESASLKNYRDALEIAVSCMKEFSAAYDKVYDSALLVFGPDPQVDMMIEEMSELTKALLKYRRWNRFDDHTGTADKYLDAIAEEMADVEIVMAQMKKLFHCENDVRRHKGEKMERLAKRVDYALRYGGQGE